MNKPMDIEKQIREILKSITCYNFEDMPNKLITQMEDQKTWEFLSLFTTSVDKVIGSKDLLDENDTLATGTKKSIRNVLRGEQHKRKAKLLK
jgi:hypothetical protein